MSKNNTIDIFLRIRPTKKSFQGISKILEYIYN